MAALTYKLFVKYLVNDRIYCRMFSSAFYGRKHKSDYAAVRRWIRDNMRPIHEMCMTQVSRRCIIDLNDLTFSLRS